jgi:cytosine/adenosine deaminase-related metal-dependent hydrolase
MSLIEKTSSTGPTVHKAGWVMIDPETIIQDGFVRVASGKITDVGQGRCRFSTDPIIHHGSGVLMPSLVNAHTHLDLCALKQATDMENGFIRWIQSVIQKKAQTGRDKLFAAAQAGIDELKASGTGIVGDICSSEISPQFFLDSGLSGVWFQEYLGTGAPSDLWCEKMSDTQTISIAGHAPHTTAPELLVRLKSAARKAFTPFSLHLAESADEVRFMTTGKGEWADFLTARGIDTSAWGLTDLSPVKHAGRLGLLDKSTLAVHLVFADDKDIAILSEKQVHACICPRSNMHLHKCLPNVPMMMGAGLRLCLGTDSLASNDSLSLFDEMAFLSHHFPEIAPRDILMMATINGASALGFDDHFGRLTPERFAKMIYVPVAASGPDQVMEALVNAAFSGNIK